MGRPIRADVAEDRRTPNRQNIRYIVGIYLNLVSRLIICIYIHRGDNGRGNFYNKNNERYDSGRMNQFPKRNSYIDGNKGMANDRNDTNNRYNDGGRGGYENRFNDSGRMRFNRNDNGGQGYDRRPSGGRGPMDRNMNKGRGERSNSFDENHQTPIEKETEEPKERPKVKLYFFTKYMIDYLNIFFFLAEIIKKRRSSFKKN